MPLRARRTHRYTVPLLALAPPILLFAALAVGMRTGDERALDVSLMRLVHGASMPTLDGLALLLSTVASSVGLALLAAALALVLLARGRRGDVVFLASSLAPVGPLVAGLKDAFERPRPALWESITPAGGFSFPSGHASASLTLALVVLGLAWKTRWRWLAVVGCVTFGFGVGLSRVYLGVHFPSDVVAGWCVAASWMLALSLLRIHLVGQRGRLLPSEAR